MATFDGDIVVNILSTAGAVTTQDFGVAIWVTDALEAGFTERVRFYESSQAVNADADLQQATKDALNAAFAQNPRLRKLAVGKISYIAVISDEMDAIKAEADQTDGFYFIGSSSRVEGNIVDLAAWAETQPVLYLPQTSDAALLAGTAGNIGEDLRLATRARTALTYNATDTEYNGFSWGSKTGAADPDEQSTTWRNKTLSGITPQVTLTDTEKANILAENANVYLTLKGQGSMGEGTLADGNPIDTRIARDWLEFRIGEGLAQLFLDVSNRNSKVPFDNDGIAQIGGVLEAVAARGEKVGHLLAGASTVSLPLRKDVPPADVTARTLTVPMEVTLAGAIEEATINVVVNFA
jgi:hypothetical protein